MSGKVKHKERSKRSYRKDVANLNYYKPSAASNKAGRDLARVNRKSAGLLSLFMQTIKEKIRKGQDK